MYTTETTLAAPSLPGKHIVVYYFVFQDTSRRNSPSAKLINNHFSKFMSQTQR